MQRVPVPLVQVVAGNDLWVCGAQALGQRRLALQADSQRLPLERGDREDLAAHLEHGVVGVERERLLGARKREAGLAQPRGRHDPPKVRPRPGSSTTPASPLTVPIRAASGWWRASRSTAEASWFAGTTQQKPQPMLKVSHMSSAETSARSAMASKIGSTGSGESIEKPTPGFSLSRLSSPSPVMCASPCTSTERSRSNAERT